MEKNQIFIKCGTDYTAMTKELLAESDLAGLISAKAKEKKGELRIGIKPNLVSPTEASWGGTTHPEIVAGIIEYLQEKGFANLVMLEGSWVGDKTAEACEVCGYNALSEKYGVPFLDMQKEKGVKKDCGGMELNICRAVETIDFLINVPVLKGHCQTKITCALKNMKGLIPNSEKRRFHAMGLHKPIAHLNVGIHQDFIVVDNICGDLDFEDGGHPVVMNRILTGRDPVLIDAYVCHMMHYDVSEVSYVTLAESLGVGCADIRKADIRACGKAEKSMDTSACGKAGKSTNDPVCGKSGESAEGCVYEKSGESAELFGGVLPKSRKVVEVADAVEEVESCSACYGYLIPALDRLKEEGLLEKLHQKIAIGQGYRGKTGELGVGHCTRDFRCHLEGCPPTEGQIYDFLKAYIQKSAAKDTAENAAKNVTKNAAKSTAKDTAEDADF